MFRSSQYAEKVEYIPYTPEKSFKEDPGNDNPQIKNNIKFYVDSTNEVSPNDWYNSYFEIHFKLNKKQIMQILLQLIYLFLQVMLIHLLIKLILILMVQMLLL